MKNVPQNLIEHLNSVKNFTACDLFELRLFSGSVYYFSGADYSVTYDGKTYKPGPLITRQKVFQSTLPHGSDGAACSPL